MWGAISAKNKVRDKFAAPIHIDRRACKQFEVLSLLLQSTTLYTSFQIFRDAVNKISPIDEDDWQLCEPGLSLKTLNKSAFFVEEGKVYREIGFVVKGLLRGYYLVEGEEMNTAFYMEGQWAKAYHSFLTQTASRQWIQALEDVELITISYKHLQHLFANSPAWERFGRIATENLYVASQLRSEMLLLEKPAERYVNLTRTQPQLLERVPLYHLASYIGIKQPSLSRIRKRLAKTNTTL
jgi:CRP-like cAMP-binding protein